ncbi:leukocyte-specific transcript 1 protein isoform 5-T5 [Trichechus inunguis]|uniref:Leukocyte-specific transcript 1 protein isoform X5 n=1 Tax=Trichechus manatus latirostris TaxID=127582 RepID=A0A2Y9QDM8_TRIMA|nr:leukocyte-specific transcript 1 protein isoform X5 [Trichechus manatus latirostris]
MRRRTVHICGTGTGRAPPPGHDHSVHLSVLAPSESKEAGEELEQELHYASLQRLPGTGGAEGLDLSEGDGKDAKEDPSADYACIAKKKPT